jgi:hypothetical protein
MIPPRRARLERWIAHSESRIQALTECVDLLVKTGHKEAAKALKPLRQVAIERKGYLLRCLLPTAPQEWATPRFYLFTGPGQPRGPLSQQAAS